MDELRIMIVDDSTFSINIIEEILKNNNFNVVATASNKEEMLEKFKKEKPNFLTMDLTMPEINGFDSIKLLRTINPAFNSIMISSLKDDDLVNEAKKLRINDYLQKPTKEEDLLESIKNIVNREKNFSLLLEEHTDVFKETFKDAMTELGRLKVTFNNKEVEIREGEASFAAAAGITGNFPGRFTIFLSEESLSSLAKSVLKDDQPSYEQKANLLAEMTNIVAGNACSILNMTGRGYKFRLSSPTVFYAKDLQIFSEKDYSYFFSADSDFGPIYFLTSFSKGDL